MKDLDSQGFSTAGSRPGNGSWMILNWSRPFMGFKKIQLNYRSWKKTGRGVIWVEKR